MRKREMTCLGLWLLGWIWLPALCARKLRQLEFFEKQVRPILVEHCYECHAGSEKKRWSTIRFARRLASWWRFWSGHRCWPADQSRLIEAVRYKNRDLQMPPQKPLSPEQVAVLEKWITQRGT